MYYIFNIMHNFGDLQYIPFSLILGQWRDVITSLKDICSRESELMDEISEALLSVSGWYPPLTLLWCKLMTCLDLTSQNLWTRVLRTCQRKSVTSIRY